MLQLLLLLLWLLLFVLLLGGDRRRSCFSSPSVEERPSRGQECLLIIVPLICILSLHCHGVSFSHKLHKSDEHVLGCRCVG